MTRTSDSIPVPAATIVVALSLGLPVPALAQSIPSTTPPSDQARTYGWALDRYEPAPAGDVFFAADFPRYRAFPLPAFAIVSDYAQRVLVLRPPNEPVRPVVEGMMVLHAQATLTLLSRLDVHGSLPISLWQQGQPAGPGLPDVGAYSAPVTGDLRLGARVRILGEADRAPISLHAGGTVALGVIPYNGAGHNVTDEDFRWRGYATAAGHPGPLRWSLSLGYHGRPRTAVADAVIDDEVFATAAVGLTTPDDRLTVGPEAWFALGLDTSTPSGGLRVAQVYGELIAGLHYLLGEGVTVSAGAGPGLTQGAGTPEIRALLRIAYAPQRGAATVPIAGREAGRAER